MKHTITNFIFTIFSWVIAIMSAMAVSNVAYGFGGGTTAVQEAPATAGLCGKESSLSTCLTAKRSPVYYVDQSELYFKTMDSSVPVWVVPNYSEKVARWEWKPWLLLTGYGSWNMTWTDALLKLYPTSYAHMDCRFFEVQPFGRCHVVFDYSGEYCPIYEEFTFNDQGQMTFIEAWTDHNGYLPMNKDTDYWAEGPNVKRLSTKLPGLGNATGKIDINASWMKSAANSDQDIAEFVKRAKAPYYYWLVELSKHSDVSAGCRPPQ